MMPRYQKTTLKKCFHLRTSLSVILMFVHHRSLRNNGVIKNQKRGSITRGVLPKEIPRSAAAIVSSSSRTMQIPQLQVLTLIVTSSKGVTQVLDLIFPTYKIETLFVYLPHGCWKDLCTVLYIFKKAMQVFSMPQYQILSNVTAEFNGIYPENIITIQSTRRCVDLSWSESVRGGEGVEKLAICTVPLQTEHK